MARPFPYAAAETDTVAAAPASAATAPVPVQTAIDGRWGMVLPFGEYDLYVEKEGYVAVQEELALTSAAPVSRTIVLDIYVPPPPGRYHFTVRDAGSSRNVTTATAVLRADAATEPVSAPGGILELVWPEGTPWKRVRFDAPGFRSTVFEFGQPPAVGTTQWVYVELVPEVGEQRVVVTRTEIVIRDRVNFQSGSDRLTKDSFPVLDGIAAVLVERQDVQKVIISGHTDNVGRPAANLKLSLRRAEAVRRHLIKQGVAAERLEAVGYGQERPIADNTTAAGKAENRRVEFRIDKRADASNDPAAEVGSSDAAAPVTAPR
jgi:outer membrane protein OmpA-like peptidoglycan-associated protein